MQLSFDDQIPGNVLTEYEKIVEQLLYWDHCYYALNQPVVSDATYDMFMRDLKKLEETYPGIVQPYSPMQRVSGKAVDSFAKVLHQVPCLSLDNALNPTELAAWDARVKKGLGRYTGNVVSYMCEPKIDGLSVSVTYVDGYLVRAATRGDGVEGEDITENIKAVRCVPLKLHGVKHPIPSLIEARGEVFMTNNAFRTLNAEAERVGTRIYSNPRNAAAGSLRQLDPKETAKRNLSAYFYTTGAYDGPDIHTQEDLLHLLRHWGLPVNDQGKLCPSIEEVETFLMTFSLSRVSLGYGTDGVVIKVNMLEDQATLGAVSRSPRWAIAFKYPPEQVATRIEDIILQVGRTGAVTPVAVLTPVECGGVTVSRATLHNEDFIAEKGIRIGDHVMIQRAGEVIPEVVEVMTMKRVLSETREFVMPKVCPECGEPLTRPDGEAVWRCSGQFCPAKLKGWIELWASREGMDVEGLGPAVIDQLVDLDMIKDPLDLFSLRVEDFMKLEKMGNSSATKLVNAINSSHYCTLEKLLYSLGIRNASKGTAKRLAAVYDSLEQVRSASKVDLMKIDDIGPIVAESIVSWFASPFIKDREFVEACQKILVIEAPKRAAADSKLAGKTFVFTGTIPVPRNEAEAMAEAAGAKTSGAVGKKTDYVVAGENAGSKLAKAQELSIPVLSYDDFLAMLN